MTLAVRCSTCSRELPAAFPGATLRCACGSSVCLPASSSRESGATTFDGPYRSAQSVRRSATEVQCTYCGNWCASSLRVCPGCDVRFDSIRCTRCYTLQPPGAATCVCCSEALELEPPLDPTDAPCPRCGRPLELASVGACHPTSPHECPRCGGLFVLRDALAEILVRAEASRSFELPDRLSRSTVDRVTYLRCPMCQNSMNRVNFGKMSGVIVDVCRPHGTWFDAGELTRVVVFAASGGLEKARAREDAERKRASRDVDASVELMRFDADGKSRRFEAWTEFLGFWLGW